jgi:hypothetical protein
MARCEATTGGICRRPATWKHSVHVGNREAGRFLYDGYWCDEHAERVAEQRRRDRIPPPKLTWIAQVEA